MPANWSSGAMGVNSSVVPSGRIKSSGVNRKPEGMRSNNSPGCDQAPGMRRVISGKGIEVSVMVAPIECQRGLLCNVIICTQ